MIFLDASGFTALGERLKEEDEATAAFELSSMLNRFFTVIIDTITEYVAMCLFSRTGVKWIF